MKNPVLTIKINDAIEDSDELAIFVRGQYIFLKTEQDIFPLSAEQAEKLARVLYHYARSLRRDQSK